MKLYEITEKYRELQSLSECEDIDPQAIRDTLSLIDDEFEKKADAIACVIKNNGAMETAISTEIENLQIRKKRLKTNNRNLKSYLLNEITRVGKTKIESGRNKISISKNPESVDFDDKKKFVEWAQSNCQYDYLLKFSEPTPILTHIKEAIKSGENIRHAKLIQTERINIK